MRRREFITLVGGMAALNLWPVAVRAQQPERVRRIGVLTARTASDPEATEDIRVFAQELAILGWVIGRNVQIERRYAAGNPEMFHKYAKDAANIGY